MIKIFFQVKTWNHLLFMIQSICWSFELKFKSFCCEFLSTFQSCRFQIGRQNVAWVKILFVSYVDIYDFIYFLLFLSDPGIFHKYLYLLYLTTKLQNVGYSICQKCNFVVKLMLCCLVTIIFARFYLCVQENCKTSRSQCRLSQKCCLWLCLRVLLYHFLKWIFHFSVVGGFTSWLVYPEY